MPRLHRDPTDIMIQNIIQQIADMMDDAHADIRHGRLYQSDIDIHREEGILIGLTLARNIVVQEDSLRKRNR